MDNQILADVKTKMLKALDILRIDLQTIRTGRASPHLVENILVEAYEGASRMQLKELATIGSQEARSLLITPFDPSTIEKIIKAIQQENIGLNPISEGKTIRINLPALTQERRQEYLKLARAKAEGGKIMVRQARHDVMVTLKKMLEATEIDEDSKKRLEKQIQELTDEITAEVDDLLERKIEDLSKI